jgi:hypothetical protein
MFIETHEDGNGVLLTFIKSANVQAYPCGRRRSTAIDKDGDLENTPTDKYYFPFDPEARLNTEANNRKHSSLNGFTQTYLKNWSDTDKVFSMSLAGYLFTIEKDDEYLTADNFGNAIAKPDAANYIYANILIEDVHLFAGENFLQYYTGVLRNQSDTSLPETSLDLPCVTALNSENKIAALRAFENYYFSGLSFSTIPLTGVNDTRSNVPKTFTRTNVTPNQEVNQLVVSLCILESVEGKWKIYEPAKLPKIEHGATKDSVKILGDVSSVKNITSQGNIKVSGNTETAGNIEAERNITIGDTVITKDISASGNATIGANLTVNKKATIDELKVTKGIDVNGFVAEQSTVKQATVTEVLDVHNEEKSAQANIDKAIITEAGINKSSISEANITNLTATNGEVTGTLLANVIGTNEKRVENINAKEASIIDFNTNNLNVSNTAKAPVFKQVIDNFERPVPWIAVQPQKSTSTGETVYQLRISRTTTLAEQQIG